MNTTPIYCFVTSNLCDNKMISWMPPTSHWRCDDQPWSWLWSLEMIVIHFVWIHKIIINIWIWGRRRANCCWSYYVFLYDCCSAPCKWKMRAEHHYSANTTTTTTIKNDEKKTLTMNSCCAPSTTTPRWCLKSCCCSRLFASSWWWISFCSAAKLNTRASLNRKPPMY